ncbi:MAG TPA: hypothetical protein VKA32_03280 [Gammaproteobacteria bacterium]|nr:hypothetical protein [Gammaproteobacteria bacterium]
MPLIAVWSYLLDGVFIGATRPGAMRDTMLIAVFGAYLPVWYLTRSMGNDGLWLAFTVFTTVRSAALGWLFLRTFRRRGWMSSDATAIR